MNCAEARRLLHAHTDGELDLVRSLDVEQHLQTCAACAAENQRLKSLRSALRSAGFNYRAPASLRQNLLQAVRPAAPLTEPSLPLTEHRSRTFAAPPPRAGGVSRSWFWPWLAAGATALAVLTLLRRPAGLSDGDRLANELVANHVRSLMAGHLTDVVSSDQHTVKPWFNGKLDFAPDVKDFAAQGFPLVGGRLDYLDGHDVSALVYRRNQHTINIFVWPANRAGAANDGENYRGYNLVYRDLNGLRYALVSDLNKNELNQLADLIGK